MAFACPACHKKTLESGLSINLAPNDYEHVLMSLLTCPSCTFQGLGLSELSWHGNLEMPTRRDYGYPLTANEFRYVQEKIQQCARAGWNTCSCSSHDALRGFFTAQEWQSREEFDLPQDA